MNVIRFSDWSVRNQLMIPVITVIMIGAGATFLIFKQLTTATVGHAVPHLSYVMEFRSAVLALTGEYWEFLANSDRMVLAEIKIEKQRVENTFKQLATDHGDLEFSNEQEKTELRELVQVLFKVGDETTTAQVQIIEGLEGLEELEETIEEIIGFAIRNVDERQPVSNNENIFLTSHAIQSLNSFNFSALEILSEIREFVASGEGDTVSEILDIQQGLQISLLNFTERTDGVGDDTLTVNKLYQVKMDLEKTASEMIDRVQRRMHGLEEIEETAEQLEMRLAALVAVETTRLNNSFTDVLYRITATIIGVLFLVTLVLAVTAQRIKASLSNLTQATRNLRQGDLNTRANATHADELGLLARDFNDMAQGLQENISQKEHAEAELKTLNRNLEDRVHERTIELEKARDKAEAANQLKTHLITTMNHELRTPFTSIVGSLRLLIEDRAEVNAETRKSLLNMAWRNSDQLAALVDDIVSIERLEAGAMALQKQPIDLSILTRDSAERYQGYATEKESSLILTDMASDVMIDGDEARLLQVMANLLSNACKFSPNGENVSISVTKDEKIATVSVFDNGPGISADIQETIFERFVRGENINTRNTGGAGLGLSIAEAIIKLHGGTIDFESNPSVGTRFFFTLPLIK